MKKWLSVWAAVLLLLLGLTACQDKGADSSSGSRAIGDFQAVGVSVALGQEYTEALGNSLGGATDVVEAPSCHYDGMDTIYTFAGFALYTYRAEDKSIIYLIELKDDTAATLEGAKVGMTAGEIEALYGTGYTESGVIRSYPLGKDATLDFTMEDGKAALIEYVAK